MALIRSLLFAAIFYPATLLWVVVGIVASLFGRRPTLAVVLSWVDLGHWLARHVLGMRIRVEGRIPPGPHLIAVKHESMLETIEMVRLSNLPVIVIKRELADLPLFGLMTRRYGVIPVDRSAGAKALRNLVSEGERAIATGRPVIIYPEGTRVHVGEAPELKSGFAALYRALGFPAAATILFEISPICSSMKLFSLGCSVTSTASDRPSAPSNRSKTRTSVMAVLSLPRTART